MQLIDLLEGVTFIRASFNGVVFERWLGNIKQQPALMTLTDRCLRHAAAELTAPDCGCRASPSSRASCSASGGIGVTESVPRRPT